MLSNEFQPGVRVGIPDLLHPGEELLLLPGVIVEVEAGLIVGPNGPGSSKPAWATEPTKSEVWMARIKEVVSTTGFIPCQR